MMKLIVLGIVVLLGFVAARVGLRTMKKAQLATRQVMILDILRRENGRITAARAAEALLLPQAEVEKLMNDLSGREACVMQVLESGGVIYTLPGADTSDLRLIG
jgi:hypothetical protein